MTVILVLLTFIMFLLIDWIHSRGKVAVPVAVTERPAKKLPAYSLVNGFRLPENLSYHPGHTWALGESPNLVRVGMDDFASKLIGKIDSITLPQRGTWVRQGAKLATIVRDGKSINILSPVEGTIAEVNENAVRDPEAARKDNYGSGWLVSVNSPDLKTCFRNLFHGALAKVWTETSVSLMHAPALAQDGGEALDDFVVASGKDWEAVAKESFLN